MTDVKFLINPLGINYQKAHRSLVDLTMGYLHKSKVDKNPEKDTTTRWDLFEIIDSFREKLLEQNMRDINNIKKEQMLNYSVDPYSGDT